MKLVSLLKKWRKWCNMFLPDTPLFAKSYSSNLFGLDVSLTATNLSSLLESSSKLNNWSLHRLLPILQNSDIAWCFADIPPENSTNGYIFIHAEGGLNQQRIAVCFMSSAMLVVHLFIFVSVTFSYFLFWCQLMNENYLLYFLNCLHIYEFFCVFKGFLPL